MTLLHPFDTLGIMSKVSENASKPTEMSESEVIANQRKRESLPGSSQTSMLTKRQRDNCDEKEDIEIPQLNEDVFEKILKFAVQRQQKEISRLMGKMNIARPKYSRNVPRIKWPELLQTNSQKLVYHDAYAKMTMLKGTRLHVIELHMAQLIARCSPDIVAHVDYVLM